MNFIDCKGKYHYGNIYIHRNVFKFCGGYLLIKFCFGCIIDTQKKCQKEATRTCFTES